jgi:serine/threonine protein kinase
MSNFENSSQAQLTDVNEIQIVTTFQEVFSSNDNQYLKIRQIGVGGFGKIYMCKRVNDVLQFCLKVIQMTNPENSNTSELVFHGMTNSSLENEVNLLKNLNHPNIVKYVEHFIQEDNFIIVMEYLEGKSLKELINNQRLLNECF